VAGQLIFDKGTETIYEERFLFLTNDVMSAGYPYK
jgi:hypothetical protein